MSTDIAPYARAAYASGWAASGGPMTERVRAGCVAAIAAARERPDDPRVLEVTIDLGRLEGMWALLFHRRTEQQQLHTRLVTAAWTALFDEDTVRTLIRQIRAARGLTEADSGHDQSANVLAAAAAGAMLRALSDYGRWDGLRQALQDAIKAGRAEGMVNAVAIAAEQADVRGLDWDAAFADAYSSLERLHDTWADTSPWLARLVARSAAHLSRILTGLEADAGTDDMMRAALAVLADPDSPDVEDTVDWAMTDATDNGALDLYQTSGAAALTVITAGDGRVCAECQGAEDGSPYPADAAPGLPLHPRCRCVYSADIDLGAYASWFL